MNQSVPVLFNAVTIQSISNFNQNILYESAYFFLLYTIFLITFLFCTSTVTHRCFLSQKLSLKCVVRVIFFFSPLPADRLLPRCRRYSQYFASPLRGEPLT